MPQLLDGRIFNEWLNRSSGFFYSIKRTLHRGRTKFQEIELVDTDEFGHVLLLDGITQVVAKNDWQYHEPMVHPALLAHPAPANILVIGGGDGGILREVLKHPTVERVDFAELDAEVVEFCRRYLPDISNGAFDDSRVSVHITDGRAFVEAHPEQYDAVIMDMTDPFGPSKMLYTREFFRAVRHSFRDQTGLFVMHTESPVTRPEAYRSIRATLGAEFPVVHPLFTFIQMYATLWSVGICSDATDPSSFSPEELDRRIAERGLGDLKMISGDALRAMQTVLPFIRELHNGSAKLITDKDPDFPDGDIDTPN